MLGSEPSFSIWLRRAVETTYSELRSVSAISRLASSTWRRVRPKRSRICFSLNPAFSLRVTVVGDGITGGDSDIFRFSARTSIFPAFRPQGRAILGARRWSRVPGHELCPPPFYYTVAIGSYIPPGGIGAGTL